MSKEAINLALARNEEPVKDLSAQEERRLEQLEGLVVENFKTFIQVGHALAEIRDRKLYRKKAMTFEKYCKELFDIAKSRAYQLIDAAKVIENVHSCGQNENVDLSDYFINESQIRPLTKLRPEQQQQVCIAAINSAPKGKLTANHVKNVVKEYIGESIVAKRKQAVAQVAQKASPEFTVAFEKFSGQIAKERNSNYKFTSKAEIIKAIRQLSAEVSEDGEPLDETVHHGGISELNKLEKAGFSLFRMDRNKKVITCRSEVGGWKNESGPYDTLKAMETAFKDILLDDKHLRG